MYLSVLRWNNYKQTMTLEDLTPNTLGRLTLHCISCSCTYLSKLKCVIASLGSCNGFSAKHVEALITLTSDGGWLFEIEVPKRCMALYSQGPYYFAYPSFLYKEDAFQKTHMHSFSYLADVCLWLLYKPQHSLLCVCQRSGLLQRRSNLFTYKILSGPLYFILGSTQISELWEEWTTCVFYCTWIFLLFSACLS